LLPVGRALRLVDRGVLAGHLVRVEASLGDVGVHALGVVLDVLLDELAVVAVEVVELVDLALQVGLGVRRERPLLLVERAVAGGAARERRQLRPAQVAQDVDEEQAVLGGDVARAEHRAAARLAVDVGDAEALVAHDRHVLSWRVGAVDVVGLHPERRVLEVLGDVLGLEAGRRVDQVVVHRELVVRVRRVRAVVARRGQELADLGQRREAVRAGGRDVREALAVVVPVRLGSRCGLGRGGRCGQQRHEGECALHARHINRRSMPRAPLRFVRR
jgi:hypothetical protein